jgi:tRNA (uracil-5-)-methyltransferase TRM9
MSYDNFSHTFSESRKNHPWPELNYIVADIQRQWYRSVLDIGCGNGRFLEEAEKSDFIPKEYLWIDSSMGMIEEAKHLHPEYIFSVMNMIDMANIWKYDAIVLLASYHHLDTSQDRQKALSNIKNFLRENGRIYMTNWNLRDQERYKDSHQGNGDYMIKIGEYRRYYHGFTLDELEGLFLQTGYTIVENKIFEGGRNIVSILSES